MTDDNEEVDLSALREEIDLALLGARLEAARVRKFAKISDVAKALDKLSNSEAATRGRTYYSHEGAERRPRMSDLKRYSTLFEVPVAFFLRGGYASIPDSEIEIFRKRKAKSSDDGISRDSSGTSPLPINQPIKQPEITTSHNRAVGFIVILTASEIRHINTGRGSLANMSGPSLSVPGLVSASPHSYAYILPDHDRSMTVDHKTSIAPGSVVVADPMRTINPGDLVLVDHQDYEHPLVRIYTATRPYARGVAFKLTAFNPAYEPVVVSNAGEVLGIARVISSTHLW
jgi:hypothetical protein